MDKNMLKEHCEFYKSHLKEKIIPFWIPQSLDTDCGGYFTCYDNQTGVLASRDKYAWSQGRMVWLLSRLSEMDMFADAKSDFLQYAKSGVEFLRKNCHLPNGNVCFLMDRFGNKKEVVPGEGYDISVYADCFVILGYARYAACTCDADLFFFAYELYENVKARIGDGSCRTDPYPIPKGYKTHGHPMILLHTGHELFLAAGRIGGRAKFAMAPLDADTTFYMREILENFVDADDVLHEMIAADNTFDFKSLLGRYINPGHILEDAWFILDKAECAADRESAEKACRIAKKALELGLDRQYGGLLLFADMSGGMPKGDIVGIESEKMTAKVANDWHQKLWWVHSEALYTLLRCGIMTGEGQFFEAYESLFDYVFKVFPNPGGLEWIQIRGRDGKPEDKVVALPVKDPYHIVRNLVLMIELLNARFIK